jgi:hypothetical protein
MIEACKTFKKESPMAKPMSEYERSQRLLRRQALKKSKEVSNPKRAEAIYQAMNESMLDTEYDSIPHARYLSKEDSNKVIDLARRAAALDGNIANTVLEPLPKMKSASEKVRSQAYSHFPDKDKWRERLIMTLYVWAQGSDALDIVQFCDEYGINRPTLYAWCLHHQDIRDAIDNVKLTIGCRKRVGALKRTYAEGPAYRDQHMLDPEQAAINKYHADLKRTEGPQSQTLNITMSTAADSGIPTPEEKRAALEEVKEALKHREY